MGMLGGAPDFTEGLLPIASPCSWSLRGRALSTYLCCSLVPGFSAEGGKTMPPDVLFWGRPCAAPWPLALSLGLPTNTSPTADAVS